MPILKSKVSVIRFTAEAEHDLEVIVKGLNSSRFRENWMAGIDSVQGFCPINDIWGSTDFHEGNIKANGFIAFVFRCDIKRVDPVLLKREISERIEAFTELEGKKPSRDDRKAIKAAVKDKMLSEQKAKPSFYPVVFNNETGVGYFFATSSGVFDKFRASFKLVDGIPDIKTLDEIIESSSVSHNVDSEKFLTWVWWRAENDPTKPVGTSSAHYECSMGGNVTVSSLDTGEKVSEKSDQLHEARMALLRGLRADKASIVCCSGSGSNTEFTLGNELLNISGLTIPKMEESPSDVFEEIERAMLYVDESFAIVDSLIKEYVDLSSIGDPLPDTPLFHWSRGDFCSGSIEVV